MVRDFILANRDALVRGIFFGSEPARDEEIPDPGLFGSLDLDTRDEERRVRELIEEAGQEGVVMSLAPPLPRGRSRVPIAKELRDWAKQAEAAYGRRFGRRLGVLEVGAVGDCVVRDGERVLHAIVGGTLVLRDGEPPAPSEDRRRARWKRAEPDGGP
jgi:hypothetical protein